MTTVDERLKIGTTLENVGAIVLDSKIRIVGHEFVVLAMQPEAHDPYVTWVAGFDDDGDEILVWGHYFDKLADAVRDFESR